MIKKCINFLFFVLIAIFSFILTGCAETTVNQLKSDSGIIVNGESFKGNSKLISNEIDLNTDEGQKILDIISNIEYNKTGKVVIFDIYITHQGKKVQPDGKVKVSIPVPDNSIESYCIFHISEDGRIDELIPKRNGNNLVIDVEHFSFFVVVDKKHNHVYNSVITEPTCTEKGYTTYICECGDSYIDQYVNEIEHSYGEWTSDEENKEKHYKECHCGKKEYDNCTFDKGKVTKEPSHFEEGVKTYTCTECGRIKEESIEKNSEHMFTEWYPDKDSDNKHIRLCKCGEEESADCTFDDGKVTKEPSHFEEGVKTYTCTECGRIKEESIEKNSKHMFTEWYPDKDSDNKHIRLCKCGEEESGNCTFDDGKVTKEPSHFEEGIKTYTCTECGRIKEESIEKTEGHEYSDWYPSLEVEDKHERVCNCGDKESADCIYDEGVITKEANHLEEGIKTYTCTECGRTKEESIDKTTNHGFGKWTPDEENKEKHYKECPCGEKEFGDCIFDEGEITKEATHLEEGIKTYTCTECGRTKEESIDKTTGHDFGKWTPDEDNEEKHYKECPCGEKEFGDCTFDEGVITKDANHLEEGVKTYTCTECGRTKEESIDKTTVHDFGKWTPDEDNKEKHYKECPCGEKEFGDCIFDEGITDENTGLIIYTCTICERTKEEIEAPDGITIVIAYGTAIFEGKDTVKSDSKLYGDNANVYIAQLNDVLNVSLIDQEGRTFKYWVSATGTIIPDEDFSILVFRSGYYYPVFEDTNLNDFSNREKIFEGNCEEGTLYKSTNSKGDVKYELEFETGGYHDFCESKPYNNQHHLQECLACGEIIYEKHVQYHSEIIKPAGHTEEGQRKCECFCGHEWTESIPVTEEHTIDYDDWHIVEKSENGKYGKYRVYCQYCDYYEEYWYLGDQDLIRFMDNKMINYQYTYGGKVCHNEYYYSYKNAEDKKVYIWAIQYEYEYSSNEDYNDTYIFMYIDDEDPLTLEPVYLSKSKGDRRGEYLWAIYGYAYDVNDWIKTLDSPDYNIGCADGMLLSNSMSARSSVFESYHDYWAEIYNELRIPTTKEYNDLSDTSWEISYEGKSFQGGYYDENGKYVTTGGRDIISYVKDKDTSYKKYIHVDKETGITYGFEDLGTYYRTIFIMREYKEIVSPEEYEKLDDAGKSVVYSYGDIEKDIKSLCSKRTSFNNFTLTIPETTNAFRLLFSDPFDCVELSGSDVNVYNNSAYVYNSGSPITFTWEGEEGIAFDRYEIWDFENQKWVTLSENSTYVFNSSTDPRRDAAYIRVICHEVDEPVDPSETYRITVENGYFEIDGKEYYGTVEVPGNTHVYVYANYVHGKTFEYWLDGNGEKLTRNDFNVISNMTLTPVYIDATYRIYCEGWNYDSYVSVNGGEMYYTTEIKGKAGDAFELNTTYNTEYGCNVFIGWYMETYGLNGQEYILLSDKQTFTYEITGDESGFIYAVWTTGENPFIKKYVDIRAVNGFVIYSGGEGDIGGILDNAYSAISISNMGRVNIFDDPTDEEVYTLWDVAYRMELDGEIIHNTCESFEDEYDYYPADFWVDDPQYYYPDGEINVTGIINTGEGVGEIVLP